MAAFTETVLFKRYTTSPDGAGGLKNTGDTVTMGLFLASLTESSYSRLTEAEKLSFRNVYQVKFWKNPAYEPKEGDICEYRGKNLVVQDIRDDKDYRYYLIKAVAKR